MTKKGAQAKKMKTLSGAYGNSKTRFSFLEMLSPAWQPSVKHFAAVGEECVCEKESREESSQKKKAYKVSPPNQIFHSTFSIISIDIQNYKTVFPNIQ